MSADEPLDHCLEGATQNQDESLNSTVWNLCLKESFAGLNSVETACAIVIARFNDGSHISGTIMRRCGSRLELLSLKIKARIRQYEGL